MLSDFSTVLDNAETLLSEATEVQTFLGAADATEAAAKIYQGYQTDDEGAESLPGIIIAIADWTSAKATTSSWDGTQSIIIQFRDSATSTDTAEAKYKAFIADIETILDGMREDSNELAKLNVVNIEMTIPPRIQQEERNGDRFDSVLVAEFIIQCFG